MFLVLGTAFAQTEEDFYSLFLEKGYDLEERILISIAEQFQTDDKATFTQDSTYYVVTIGGDLLCETHFNDAEEVAFTQHDVDSNFSYFSSGYYYIVFLDKMKMYKLCPISRALKGEK